MLMWILQSSRGVGKMNINYEQLSKMNTQHPRYSVLKRLVTLGKTARNTHLPPTLIYKLY